MSGITTLASVTLICIWFGWPLHEIAYELRRIRQLAERGRR